MKSKIETNKNKQFTDTDNGPMVARGRVWVVGKMGEGGQNVQAFSYKIRHGDVVSSGDYKS